MKARKLTFAEMEDARDYLREQGYRRFSPRTFLNRYDGRTARLEAGRAGVMVTIL